MSPWFRYVLPLAAGFFACACAHAPNPAGGAQTLEIGAAETDITPPIGWRMAGYFDERFSTGVHDPLKAKALVLRQGPEQVALVCCDLVGLPRKLTAKSREQASRKTGIPVSNIVIAATHSHTGPLFMDVRHDLLHAAAVAQNGSDPHEPVDYPAVLSDRIVEAIVAAQQNLQRANLSVGAGKLEGVTFNRRYWMKNGKVAFNPGQLNPNIVRPAGPTDPEVGLLLARPALNPSPFAGLTVFAMHSDTVGGTEFSADYEYYLQETLRRSYGSKFISAFAAGTCGDLNHINVSTNEPTRGFDVAERIGTRLGTAVLQAAPGLRSVKRPSLGVRSATIRVPLQKVSPEELVQAKANITKLADPNADFTAKVIATKVLDLAERGESWPLEVQVIRLEADSALVCLPCEIFVELGLAIKHASPFKNTLVLSICNDRPSYVPTLKAFSEGSYEITNARVAPGAGEKLVDTAVKLLRALK